ncbi:MAG: hypothetical protein AAB425_13030 [Bdellovibrionota bacterium]
MGELTEVVEKLEEADEEAFPGALLETFAQKIDRIMGTANTLGQMEPNHEGFKSMGRLCALCKALGYKAAALQKPALIPIFAAFWMDTIEVIEEIIAAIEDEEKCKGITQSFTATVQKRLEWLASKVTQLDQGTASGGQNQIKVDALLKSLGIGG